MRASFSSSSCYCWLLCLLFLILGGASSTTTNGNLLLLLAFSQPQQQHPTSSSSRRYSPSSTTSRWRGGAGILTSSSSTISQRPLLLLQASTRTTKDIIMMTRGGGGVAPTTASKLTSTILEDPLVQSLTALGLTIWKTTLSLAGGFSNNVLLYQPPVGIVTLIVTYQWFQQRVLKQKSNFLKVLEDFPLQSFASGRKKHRPKSLDICATDRDYDTAGGVQAEALRRVVVAASAAAFPSSGSDQQTMIDSASACPPRASRSSCARQQVLVALEYQKQIASAVLDPTSPVTGTSDPLLLKELLELRALDALLRCVRDEDLLPFVDRLKTKVDYQQNKVMTWSTSKQQWMQRLVIRVLFKRQPPPSLQEWRNQLTETSQHLQHQYNQLGQIQHLLLKQPTILPVLDDNATQKQRQQTTKEVISWNRQAQELLREILTHRWSQVDPSKHVCEDASSPNAFVGVYLKNLNNITKWNEQQWEISLALVENSKHRHRLLSLQKNNSSYRSLWLSSFAQWKEIIQQLDFYGIPSVLLKIAIANAIHSALMPQWPQIKQTGIKIGMAVWGIVEFRFYKPLKVIVLDLLNRRPRLLDPTQLQNEQQSLFNMLKDLGIKVDELDNAAALAEASRLYEKQLKNGAVKNMIFGQMVRLLLIQVQQLKSDLLQAFQSIDELVDANRLNVSLLATIPALLLMRWGSRILYSLLYRLRVRDVSGLKDAHKELTNLLRQMERILILSSSSKEKEGKQQQQQQLSCAELGEFLSCEQKYLLLLDYCQPPFPQKQVDSIYKDVQDLLPHHGGGGLDRDTQLNLLKLIHQKNAELLKSI